MRVDAQQAAAMAPVLASGAIAVIDRHYNSLQPYKKGEQNMYAVRKDGGCTVKYVEVDGNNLVLRPHNQAYPVSVINVEEGQTVSDYIVGRVCHVSIET